MISYLRHSSTQTLERRLQQVCAEHLFMNSFLEPLDVALSSSLFLVSADLAGSAFVFLYNLGGFSGHGTSFSCIKADLKIQNSY